VYQSHSSVITNFLELSTTRENPSFRSPDSFPAFYETPTHKCSSPVPILSQTISVHITPSHLSKIHRNIIHLVLLVASFPLAFPPTTYTRSSSPPFVLHAPLLWKRKFCDENAYKVHMSKFGDILNSTLSCIPSLQIHAHSRLHHSTQNGLHNTQYGNSELVSLSFRLRMWECNIKTYRSRIVKT
jgi:hypothetical protein